MNRIRFLHRITLLAPVALFTSSCDTLQDSVAPAASIMGARELTPGTHVVDLAAAGHDWKYTIHVPGHPRLDPAAPLVIVLHGSGEDGYTHLVLNGWIEESESAGFAVAAPDGLALDPDQPANLLTNPTFWNAEQPYLTDRRRAIDDLAFFDALLDDIAARTTIDPKRIFVTGHSGGAGMAFRLAAQRSERFAGMAAVASPCWQNDPRPAKAVPSLFIVGTLDPIVPSGGGNQNILWLQRTTPPVSEILAKWGTALGCTGETLETRANGLRTIEFRDCALGAPFEAILVEGHGHRWPGGGTPMFPEFLIGPTTNHFDATAAIWQFFDRVSHRPPSVSLAKDGPRTGHRGSALKIR